MPSADPAAADLAGALGRARGEAAERLRPLGMQVEELSARLAVSAVARPHRVAHATAALAGDLHDTETLSRELGIAAPSHPAALVAAAYTHGGEAVLERLRGVYALLIWDHQRDEGLIAEDALGGRSVFVYRAGDTVLFASELAPLLRLMRTRPDPDAVSVAHWLTSHSTPPRRTLYANVERIGAGRCLRLRRGAVSVERYWRPRYRGVECIPHEELAPRLRAGLERAVDRRLGAQRKVGALVSGGIDSSVVAAVGARSLASRGRALHLYSAVYPDDASIDESRFLDALVTHLDVPSSRLRPEGRGALSLALDFQRAWEVPLQVPGLMIERPLLERARAEGVTAVLDGQGGDELFGHAPYVLADMLRHGRLLGAWRLARRFPGIGHQPGSRLARHMFVDAAVKGAVPYRLHEGLRRRRDPARYAPAWFLDRTARVLEDSSDPWAWKRTDGEPLWWSELAWRLTEAREVAGISDYLRRRASDAGVEPAPALLDVDLVELVLSFPPDAGFDPLLPRPVVREAMRGLIPDEVRLRADKSDFTAFYHYALLRDLPGVRRLLDDPGCEVAAYVDVDVVRRQLLDRPPAAGRPGWVAWGASVWNLASLECWLRGRADRLPQDAFARLALERPAAREVAT